MADDRNRVSITLTHSERAEVEAVADVLGIKPTRVVYECVKAGMGIVLESGQKMQRQIDYAQHLKKQVNPKKSDKPRTNTQRK